MGYFRSCFLDDGGDDLKCYKLALNAPDSNENVSAVTAVATKAFNNSIVLRYVGNNEQMVTLKYDNSWKRNYLERFILDFLRFLRNESLINKKI